MYYILYITAVRTWARWPCICILYIYIYIYILYYVSVYYRPINIYIIYIYILPQYVHEQDGPGDSQSRAHRAGETWDDRKTVEASARGSLSRARLFGVCVCVCVCVCVQGIRVYIYIYIQGIRWPIYIYIYIYIIVYTYIHTYIHTGRHGPQDPGYGDYSY